MSELPRYIVDAVDAVRQGVLPPVWQKVMRESFEDLHRTHNKLMESEQIVYERKRRYRAMVMRKAPTDRRLKTKGQEELRIIADSECMRDSRTKEDITDQNWWRARVGSLATYMKSVMLMHQLGLLPKEPPR